MPKTPHKFAPLFTWRSAICDSGLPPTTRHVALTVSLHMNERGGSCYPTLDQLADETGLSRSTVQTHRKALEDAGWLILTERGTSTKGRHGQRANAYEAATPIRYRQETPDPEGQVPADDKSGTGSPEVRYRETVPQGDIEGDSKGDISTSVASAPDHPSRLANLLADLIEANGGKRPTVGKRWVQSMDRLLRLDRRMPGDVEQVIRWCQQDEFWLSNILSPDKLRKQYDRLRLRMQQDAGRRVSRKTTIPNEDAFRDVYGDVLGGTESDERGNGTGSRGDARDVAAPGAGTGDDRSVARVPDGQAAIGPGDGDGEAAVEDAEVLPDDR